MINIYNYISYRSFIKDYYIDQKRNDSKFSYQRFADLAGFSTKTFIPKVIKGEKKLAQRSMFLLIKAMKLNKKEAAYFEVMVDFNNSKYGMMEHYFRTLQACSKKSGHTLKQENFFYCFGEWYYRVLCELIPIFDWKDDFKSLAKSVLPSITSAQTKKAVKRLEELELIKRDESSGRYIQTLLTVFVDPLLMSLVTRRFEEQILQRGVEVLNNNYKNQKLNTITKSVSSDEYKLIEKEMDEFHKRIAKIINSDSPKEKVIQLNTQLFPITKPLRN